MGGKSRKTGNISKSLIDRIKGSGGSSGASTNRKKSASSGNTGKDSARKGLLSE